MSDKSVFAKYADYVNKYKPDLQPIETQASSVSDYRKRLDEIKEEVYSQAKPAAPIPNVPSRIEQEAKIEPAEAREMPTQIIQKAASDSLSSGHDVEDAVKNYVEYVHLNTLEEQTPMSTQRFTSLLPDDTAVLELILVREVCQIMMGGKLTDNICVLESGCVVNEGIPVHLEQLIKKIVFEQSMNRMEVITKYKLLHSAGDLPEKLAMLLYDAVLAVDAAVWEAAAECDNLILFDSKLNGVYETLSVLAKLAQKISTTENVLEQLEQFCRELSGLAQAKTVQYILFEMCQYYVKTYLFEFLIYGVVEDGFIITFDTGKALLGQYELNMNKIGIFEPVEEDILILGRNNYIIRSIFAIDVEAEPEEENSLKRLASEQLSLDNVLRKLTPDNPSQFYQLIQNEAKESQTRLLKLLVDNYNFKAALTAIHRFFLLEASDLFQIFLEASHSELEKPVEQANLLRLNNLFKLSCETSSVREEYFMEDFSVRISQFTFLQLFHLVNDGEAESSEESDAKVGNMLQLEFKCPRELEMIFTEEFMREMDLIFRRILREKEVDTMLTQSWLILNELKNISRNVAVFNYIYRLLNEMQDFSRQLEFQTSCVLLEAEQELEENLQRSVSVDEVGEALQEFAKFLLKQLRLTDADTSMLLDTLFADCLVFSRFIAEYFEFQQSDVVREMQSEQQRIESFKHDLLAQVESSKVAIRKLSDGFGEKVEKWRRIVGM